MDILERVAMAGVIPVIKIEDPAYAVPLANAIMAGGIRTIEVTVRNDTAFESIRLIHENVPGMMVGACTILTPEMVDQAQAAGADYIVAPGLNLPTVRRCKELDLPIVPGCVTPSEIQTAIDEGLKVLKFFPAGTLGGVEALKLMAGPFPGVKFVPTGGITFDNLGEYLSCKAIAACGGSFMAKADLIKANAWDQITENCRKAVNLALGFRLVHVGINHETEEEASAAAARLANLFCLPVRNCSKSVFADPYVENMKFKFYGEKGHIGFKTNSLDRAVKYLRTVGVEFNEESCQYDAAGKLTCIYLKEEVGGFAIHLV